MSMTRSTYTAGQVIDAVKRQFGDESGVQVTDADIYRWINAAQSEISSKHRVLKAVSKTDLLTGQRDYNLTSLPIMQIETVHYNGVRLNNLDFATAERYILDHDDESKPGPPELWYTYGNIMYIWPVPAEDVTNGLTVYYTRSPNTVSAPSDILDVPDSYFEAVIAFVMSKAYQLDEEFDASSFERSMYQAQMEEKSEEGYTSATLTYPMITIVE